MAVLDVTQDEFLERVLSLIPNGWFSVEAKQPGGNLYALMKGMAANSRVVFANLIAVQTQSTFATATGNGLDTLVANYFGDSLPRRGGESDAAYRARAISRLFLPVGTRDGMNSGLIRALNPYTSLTADAAPGATRLNVVSTAAMSVNQKLTLQDGVLSTSVTITGIVSITELDVTGVPLEGHTYPTGSTVVVGTAPKIMEPNDTFATGGYSNWSVAGVAKQYFGPLAFDQGGSYSSSYSKPYQCLIVVQQPEPSSPYFLYYEEIMDLVNSLKPAGTICWVRVNGPTTKVDGTPNTGGKPLSQNPAAYPACQ